MPLATKPGLGRGVLHPKARAGKFQSERFHAGSELTPYVEHYWTVSWDLEGQPPFVQETLPHPSLHLVIEHNASELVGAMTGRFTRVLEGRGRVFAAKFRPGGFWPWCGGEIARFTDRRPKLDEVFPQLDVAELERSVLGAEHTAAMAERLEAFLLERAPQPDEQAQWLAQLVADIERTPALLRVEQVAERYGKTPRALQRLFHRYVGVSPKWVVDRYRMHEAAESLAQGEPVVELALRLGYADQAHFTRAFRDVVGQTPAAYARRNLERPK